VNQTALSIICASGLVVLGCSSGGSSAAGNDAGTATTSGLDATTGGGGADAEDTWFDAGQPQSIPATSPGVLMVGPPGLALTVGQKAALSVKLYDSAGTAQTVGPLTFTSEGPGVVSVDAAGNATGVALGTTTVTVSDGQHGSADVVIDVVDQAPTGPAGITFDPPFVTLAVGASKALAFTVTDAAGHAISPAPSVTLASDAPSMASVSGNTLQGLSAGPGTVSASAGAQTLAGAELFLVSGASSAGGSGSGGSSGSGGGSSGGGGSPTVDGCCIAHAPRFFSQPGLEDSLRVWVFLSTPPANGGLLPGLAVVQQSPDSVQLDRQGVVAVGGDGMLSAVAGGRAKYKLFVGNQLCGQETVAVVPDVSGTWNVSCDGGTGPGPGSVSFFGFPPSVASARTAQCSVGASNGVFELEAAGSGCLSPPGKAACSGPAYLDSASWGGLQGFGTCGSDAGFTCPFALYDCTGAATRLVASDDELHLVAPGKMLGASCVYEQGAGAGACEAGAPAPASVTFTVGSTQVTAGRSDSNGYNGFLAQAGFGPDAGTGTLNLRYYGANGVPTMNFSTDSFTGVGTFPLTTGFASGFPDQIPFGSGSSSVISACGYGGTVTVTAYDRMTGHVAGSFSFDTGTGEPNPPQTNCCCAPNAHVSGKFTE
jgi:hypothetical protein